MTMTGIQIWANSDKTFAQLHGWSTYFGSIRPPIEIAEIDVGQIE